MKNPIARVTASPELPDRYHLSWPQVFYDQLPSLSNSATILDFGSGRKPTLDSSKRPDFCRYIGLDPSADELERAGPTAYNEFFVAPIETFIPEIEGQIDLAISWQVLEHVDDLERSLTNVRKYLKPGGHLVSMLSGRYASFAIINRLIPERVGVAAMEHLLGREPDSVFRAKYDDCTFTRLTEHLNSWSEAEVFPHYRGAGYFRFSGLAQRAYLQYENQMLKRRHWNLASHYVIRARS